MMENSVLRPFLNSNQCASDMTSYPECVIMLYQYMKHDDY